MRVEACGATLAEARTKLKEQLANDQSGLYALGLAPPPELLHERIVFDGTKVLTQEDRSVADALRRIELSRALSNIPAEATIAGREENPPGNQRTENVEAFSEDEARTQLRKQHGSNLIILSITQEVAGRKGFLGIGKKTPNQYLASVQTAARVTVTYKFARVLGFARSHRESPVCGVCRSTFIGEADIRKAMDGIEEDYVPSLCDGCFEWICYWCACHLLAPALIPTDHREAIRRSLILAGNGRVKHLECDGFLRTFKSLANEWAQ
jgi:hypothetical protein